MLQIELHDFKDKENMYETKLDILAVNYFYTY